MRCVALATTSIRSCAWRMRAACSILPKLREALTENRKVEKMITAAYTMPED